MIDLHVHSTYSDGSDSPSDIIMKSKDMGLYAVALTDHDNIDGIKEANKVAHKYGVRFIPGIELSVRHSSNRLLHILGLGINSTNPEFLSKYNHYRDRREYYLDHVFNHFNKMKIPIHPEDVMPYASGDKLDRQAVCKWLVANGYAKTITHAWIDFVDHIPYNDKELASKDEAFNMIRTAGGKSFLAHYTKPIGLYGYSFQERIGILRDLKTMGLDGIERYYPTFSYADNEEAQYYIDHLGLMPSGGTDYHGENRKGNELAIGSGDFQVPNRLADQMMSII